MQQVAFRSGDRVEVRSAAEIRATLDDQGAAAGLPFMPEMLQYCGRRFVVDRRAERICDTIYYSGSRKLRDTVLLKELRCDGSGHDGCQAECRLFWKESWLRRIGPGEPISAPSGDEEARTKLAQLVAHGTKQTMEVEGKPVERYRCQVTELFKASESHRHPGQFPFFREYPYFREYTTGNIPFGRYLRVVARATIKESLRKIGLVRRAPLRGTKTSPVAETPLNLKPGEWVQVKTKEEIAETLNPEGSGRGLWFDWEMLPYCGKTYRVRQRIDHFIHDADGRMVKMKSNCVTLEGAVCSGELSVSRWFCPRAIFSFWRESWLRRISEPTASKAEALESAPPGQAPKKSAEPRH